MEGQAGSLYYSGLCVSLVRRACVPAPLARLLLLHFGIRVVAAVSPLECNVTRL